MPMGLSSNVVYKFTCQQCQHCYIGETHRHLATRIKEHLNGRPLPSEVTKHVHQASEENFKIVLNTRYLKVAESIVIRECRSTTLLNEQTSSVPLILF